MKFTVVVKNNAYATKSEAKKNIRLAKLVSVGPVDVLGVRLLLAAAFTSIALASITEWTSWVSEESDTSAE